MNTRLLHCFCIVATILMLNGCEKSIPKIKNTVRITIKFQEDLKNSPLALSPNLPPSREMEVTNPAVLSALEHLMRPYEPENKQFGDSCVHALDATLWHSDGTKSTVFVYWSGDNPAIVSFDGIRYYRGGLTTWKDGATHLFLILNWELRKNDATNPFISPKTLMHIQVSARRWI